MGSVGYGGAMLSEIRNEKRGMRKEKEYDILIGFTEDWGLVRKLYTAVSGI